MKDKKKKEKKLYDAAVHNTIRSKSTIDIT